MKQLWIVPLAVAAAAISGMLIRNDLRNVIDVFQRADPTGAFGLYFHLGWLAANLAVVALAIASLLPRARSEFRLRYAALAFIPSVLQGIAVLPCLLPARPGSLCGVWVILIAQLAIPVTLAAAAAFFVSARHRTAKLAGAGLAVLFVGGVASAHLMLAPADPAQCRSLDEVTKRSTCLNVFAARRRDANLCRGIEFRSTRFSCLRDIAYARREPNLCEEIRDGSPVAAYEAPAASYRDGCFQALAYALRDRGQCAKIDDSQLRARCLAGVH